MKRKILLLLLLVSLLPWAVPHQEQRLAAAEKPFIMAYIHAKTNYSELVATTNGALTEVSLDWLGVNDQGHLIIDEKKYNAAFIEEMHAQGIKVVPMLSNAFSRELGKKALDNMDVLTDEIARMVYERDFDGINYDFENLSEQERDQQTAFVRMLKAKMPDKSVSVAVCANPSNWTKGWHASYDMAALAASADYLMLMAYDEGYSGGPEKPVASIGYVESCIQDLLKRGAPAEKIVLGIPHYGRLWSKDGSQAGLGVELTAAEKIITSPLLSDKVLSYDETAQTAKLTFTAHSPYPLYSWKDIPAGEYTLWYENERSLQQKIALVHKYGLMGLGNWSLGQADASIWNLIAPWSEGRFYNDIAHHWAEASISYAVSSGWMRWIQDGDFLPEQALLRCQVAATLQPYFQLADIERSDYSRFIDINENYWAWQSIQAVVYQGMMSGTGDSLFSSEQVFTRAQFASIFDRLITAAEDKAKKSIDWQSLDNPYADLPQEHWAAIPLLRMVDRGLLAGYDENGSRLIKPDQAISRAEMAVLLQRMESWFEIGKDGWRVVLN